MKRSFRASCLALVMACIAFQARGQGLGTPNPEDIKHGSILCSWWIELQMKLTSDWCFPKEDSELKAALGESIEKIDRFIMDNMPMTQEEFADFKQRTVSGLSGMHACSAPNLNLYERIRHAPVDREAMRAATAKLLAVPRKPVANPCL